MRVSRVVTALPSGSQHPVGHEEVRSRAVRERAAIPRRAPTRRHPAQPESAKNVRRSSMVSGRSRSNQCSGPLSSRSKRLFSPVPISTTVPAGFRARKVRPRRPGSRCAGRSPTRPRPGRTRVDLDRSAISRAFGSRSTGRRCAARARAASGMTASATAPRRACSLRHDRYYTAGCPGLRRVPDRCPQPRTARYRRGRDRDGPFWPRWPLGSRFPPTAGSAGGPVHRGDPAMARNHAAHVRADRPADQQQSIPPER